MINGKDTLFIIALVYVVVFIVLTVCFKNNKENFAQAPTISLQRAIEGKRANMIQQMGKQQDQNKRISDLKKVISNLRTDLTIIKGKAEEEEEPKEEEPKEEPKEEEPKEEPKEEEPKEEPKEEEGPKEEKKEKEEKKVKLTLKDFSEGMNVTFEYNGKNFMGEVVELNSEKKRVVVSIDGKNKNVPPSMLTII